MHNIDRTNLESNYGEYTGEFETDEFGYEFEGDQESETYGEYTGEYEGEYTMESPFSEAEEMELAAELLTISNEAELDQFLGKLFKKVGRAVGGVIKSPIGRALGGALKGVAKTALPMLGSAAGNFLLPGVGGAVGGKLASAAGRMFGLELEGLSYEDQEFEVAKQVVRLSGAAAQNAAQAPPSVPPQQAAQAALTTAAQQFAPGLLRPAASQTAVRPGGRPNGHGCSHKATGRWIRRGKAIIIMGA
jgi:hypothetical protein